MSDLIDEVLAWGGGVGTRHRLLGGTRLDGEVRRGGLVPVFPRTYARPWDVEETEIREIAAVLSVGRPAVLSHLSALRRRGLPVTPTQAIHVTTLASRHPEAKGDQLVVHRAKVLPENTLVRRLPTESVAKAVVTCWPLLTGSDRRAPAIVAIRDRMVTASDLRRAMSSARVHGRAELERLIGLLEAGCESELELWGYTGVFTVPGLRHATRQRVVRVNGGTYRLDMATRTNRSRSNWMAGAITRTTPSGNRTSGVTWHWRRSGGRPSAYRTVG